MKTIAILLTCVFGCTLSVSAQLNADHNRFRAGDVLVKQQVEYINPGEPGPNKLWDFSKLKSVNDEYTIDYALPPLEGDSIYILGTQRFNKKKVRDNELIVGTEHNTMYYFHLLEGSLLQTGHENSSVILNYVSPMTLMRFPLNYSQSVKSDYKSKGLYCSTVDIQTRGTITTTADAYGKMILPSGDTLSPVLRVTTVQTIFDIPAEGSYTLEGATDAGKQLETCRWYSKGYRYPVFETIRNSNLSDNSEIFKTAFFFPPQDHLYLETDPENLALIDELWKETENNTSTDNQGSKTATLEDIMTCKMYPNPVESFLNLEYELKEDAKVSFELYSMDGLKIKTISPKNKLKGMYHETLDCSSLNPRNYVLRITADGVFVNEIIMKK